MDHLPVCLELRGRDALVIGGGSVAARKAELLLRAGARVRVAAPALAEGWSVLAPRVRHQAVGYSPELLHGAAVVIVATDDERVNAEAAREARSRGIPVNVVDRPELGDLIMPAIVDRSPVLVAVSTGGAAPVLARRLRARLETLIPRGLGTLAALARDYRKEVKRRLADPLARRRFWEQALDGEVARHALAGRRLEAERALQAQLRGAAEPPGRGEVYLVGAGPGDPELLTLRALRLMQQADVILHDRLVPEAVLDLARRDAERISVGKGGAHGPSQREINRRMIALAREGRRVCRLKGGDPFIFGRGGEEALALARAGIPFEVVPGITAATGCAAAAHIPLTHRGTARAVTFVTGHCGGDALAPDLDWRLLGGSAHTLVFYMGVANLPEIVRRLIAHGRPPDTPAAIVENGTRPRQRVVVAPLAELPARAAAAAIGAPALIVVGEVAGLAEQLKAPPGVTVNDAAVA